MARLPLVLLLFLYGIGHASAETRYVTDQSQITMRKGQSTEHKIVRMLSSGEKVEELGASKASGYSKVRTEDGATGYVLTRQLLSEPVARDQLTEAEARLLQAQQAADKLAAKLARVQQANDELKMTHEETKREKQALEQELASIKYASANVMEITQERTELRKQVVDLTRQVGYLKQENGDLKNHVTQRWFLIGAGVTVGGILIGLVLPHLHLRRRKSAWGSL